MVRKRRCGFTLVEVISATLILSGTILGFLRIMADNLRITRETERRMTAIVLAEGDMERIKGALHSDFDTNISAWSNDLESGYLASRSVTSQGTYLKEIAIEVGYDTNGNSSLDSDEVLIELNTQYAEY
jgi:Tfp pilus assembly protein PilV